MDATTAAHPSSINQGVFAAFTLERNINAVPGSARPVIHNYPLLAQNAIDQCRFAHIGAANHGYLDTVLCTWARNPLRILPLNQLHLEHFFRNRLDRKSTRLNSSHVRISYAVFCLKKKIGTFKVSRAS